MRKPIRARSTLARFSDHHNGHHGPCLDRGYTRRRWPGIHGYCANCSPYRPCPLGVEDLQGRPGFDGRRLPREVQQNIDMESYRIQQTGSGKISLERKPGVLDPQGGKGPYNVVPEELESLSRIIAGLNERFGLNLGPEHRVTLGQMMDKLDADA